MPQLRFLSNCGGSRSPRGERGLKFFLKFLMLSEYRRSPRGERGLKLCLLLSLIYLISVALLAESVD